MKRKQSVIAVTCLIAGIVGFGSVYATEKAAQKRAEQEITKQTVEQQTASNDKDVEEDINETLESVSKVVPAKENTDNELTIQDRRNQLNNEITDEKNMDSTNVADAASDTATSNAATSNAATSNAATSNPVSNEVVDNNATASNTGLENAKNTTAANTAEKSTTNEVHFAGEGLTWPLDGDIVLAYSMDKAIYFPTLDQYRCNPAVVIGGNVNDKVYLIGPGTITDVSTNEETGLTVTEDLGDGYTAVYGQLKELNFDKGDAVEAGQVIGYVSEPTKYYSTEGSNLYFAMEKDGAPIDPMTYFD